MRISFQNINISLAGRKILDTISFEIKTGEQWALVGESGSGKTTLAKAIAKQLFFSGDIEFVNELNQESPIKIELIDQQHRFKNKFNTNQFYYQQRFNSSDAEETITVMEELKEVSSDEADIQCWTKTFSLDQHLDKSLLLLSNGENKRLQLTKALLRKPDLLILDNPYVGLDTAGRKQLSSTLDKLSEKGLKLIIIAQEQDLPNCITHVAVLHQGSLIECREPMRSTQTIIPEAQINQDPLLLSNILQASTCFFETAVKMVNVNIAYNNKHVLKNINWEVKKGEKWAISGPNGTGKSTLLSLINADNPQGYANEIYLFDKKRGTGESIWDIKKNIGFVSPELHLYFEKEITCFQTIASGLFDTIGLFRKLNPIQKELVDKWMELFGIEEVGHKTLQTLPLGIQRLILLGRALIKNPALLVLDEPNQGLDQNQTERFKQILDSICNNREITLIYTSHYSEEWPNCIQQQLKLEAGEILYERE